MYRLINCRKKYIDADGVIMTYDYNDYPIYFLEHPETLINKQLILRSIPEDYIILSKVATIKESQLKREFYSRLFPNNKIILTFEDKHLVVNPIGNILIDDYNKNLEAWRDAGGIPVKFINGINSERDDMICVNKDNLVKVLSAYDSTVFCKQNML